MTIKPAGKNNSREKTWALNMGSNTCSLGGLPSPWLEGERVWPAMLWWLGNKKIRPDHSNRWWVLCGAWGAVMCGPGQGVGAAALRQGARGWSGPLTYTHRGVCEGRRAGASSPHMGPHFVSVLSHWHHMHLFDGGILKRSSNLLENYMDTCRQR